MRGQAFRKRLSSSGVRGGKDEATNICDTML